MTWLEICLVLAVGVLLGGLAGALWDIRRLHAKMWDRWVVEGALRRQLQVEQAGRAHDSATYRRRVDRWRSYVVDLQDFCVREGLLAQWRADADRQAMPFVDSGVAPLDG